jgi:ATP-binding cassette subfamily F protein 3
MSILRLAGVSREIGTLRILDSVDAAVPAGARIGLVGPNGAGKTTLLRIAAGLDQPDAGRVERKRGLAVTLLAQEAGLETTFAAARDVRSYVRSGAARLERLESELRRLEGLGVAAVESEEYADTQHRFEAAGGYALDQRVDEALSGLGFARADWDRSPGTLSGGEQTRLALARVVLADPDLLLLDEPTNHLDVAALEWLESALLRREGALIIASHDRAFLDTVPERIWELRDRRVTVFRGGYSAYAVQREERDALRRREAAARSDEIAREERLVATYRSHRKFAKMHEHEARLERLETIDVPRDGRRLSVPIRALTGRGVRSGEIALRIVRATVGIGGRRLVFIPRLEVRRGERIGVVGPNGIGKTTLIRALGGDLAVLDGELHLDRFAEIGYLAQLRSADLPGDSVLDAVLAQAAVQPGEARGHLARFLFSGDDVFKSVSVLSGGERSRLELALLGLRPSNVLLLDEPTNHLDIPAREALEAFLRETDSTAVVVSHDRRFLDATCQRLLVIAPRAASTVDADPTGGAEAVAVPFDGTYSQWRSAAAAGWDAQQEAARLSAASGLGGDGETARRSRVVPRAGAGEARSPRRSGRPGDRRGASLSKDAYRRRRQIVEDDLTRLGLRRGQIELALADPSVQANFVELRRLTSELADVEAAMASAEDSWLALEEMAPR